MEERRRSPWIDPINAGDVAAVEALFDQGLVSWDTEGVYRSLSLNPLGLALMGNQESPHVEIVRLLIRKGAPLDVIVAVGWGFNHFKHTAIGFAIERAAYPRRVFDLDSAALEAGAFECISMLVKAGCPLTQPCVFPTFNAGSKSRARVRGKKALPLEYARSFGLGALITEPLRRVKAWYSAMITVLMAQRFDKGSLFGAVPRNVVVMILQHLNTDEKYSAVWSIGDEIQPIKTERLKCQIQ